MNRWSRSTAHSGRAFGVAFRLAPALPSAFVVAFASSAACQRVAPPRTEAAPPARRAPLAPARAIVIPSAAPAPPLAVAAVAPADADADPEAPSAATIAAAVASARRLVREQRYDDAVEAFAPALTGASPDTRALTERGTVLLQYIPKRDDDAADDFRFAIEGRGDAAAHAEAWFELGQLETRRGHLETARAAYAHSLALSPNAAAASALAGRSACLARVEHEGGLAASVASGWNGVCAATGRCDDDSTPPAEARKRACVALSGGVDSEVSHGCKSPPPWTLNHDYAFYNYKEDFVLPAAKGQYLVISADVGGWPAHFQTMHDAAFDVFGKVVQARYETTDMKAAPGHVEDGIGWPSPTEEAYSFIDRDTGALLALITLVQGDSITLSVDSAKRVVQIVGAPCGGSVALDGTGTYH